MKKIISVFQRNYDGDRLIRDEVVPGAEWVLAGEGIATRKFDGVCTAVIDGTFYKRYDAKNGKTPPEGFIPAQDPDSITGHWPGWLKVGDGPEDKWLMEAWRNYNYHLADMGGGMRHLGHAVDGTYEAIGPHFQGNPEGLPSDSLIMHGIVGYYFACPRDFNGLRDFIADLNIEGIVFHHPDGRMAKVKLKDYGIKRKKMVGYPSFI